MSLSRVRLDVPPFAEVAVRASSDGTVLRSTQLPTGRVRL
jgi:hypothetical protein